MVRLYLGNVLYCYCGNLLEDESDKDDICVKCGNYDESEVRSFDSYYDYMNVASDCSEAYDIMENFVLNLDVGYG